MVNALAQMEGTPVLIIGDMVADVYLDGEIARISREAPVLVLEEREERVVAGGAANVANNAATIGGSSYAGARRRALGLRFRDGDSARAPSRHRGDAQDGTPEHRGLAL